MTEARLSCHGLCYQGLFCGFWCVHHLHIFLYRPKSGAGLAKCSGNSGSAEKAAGADRGGEGAESKYVELAAQKAMRSR